MVSGRFRERIANRAGGEDAPERDSYGGPPPSKRADAADFGEIRPRAPRRPLGGKAAGRQRTLFHIPARRARIRRMANVPSAAVRPARHSVQAVPVAPAHAGVRGGRGDGRRDGLAPRIAADRLGGSRRVRRRDRRSRGLRERGRRRRRMERPARDAGRGARPGAGVRRLGSGRRLADVRVERRQGERPARRPPRRGAAARSDSGERVFHPKIPALDGGRDGDFDKRSPPERENSRRGGFLPDAGQL